MWPCPTLTTLGFLVLVPLTIKIEIFFQLSFLKILTPYDYYCWFCYTCYYNKLKYFFSFFYTFIVTKKARGRKILVPLSLREFFYTFFKKISNMSLKYVFKYSKLFQDFIIIKTAAEIPFSSMHLQNWY